MNIWFDSDFGATPWPGPLAGCEARFGEAWVGPHGMLGILETQVGLSAPVEAEGARIAALVPHVQRIDGFWKVSAQADPMGVARTLLRWRDALWGAGWRGQAVSPRLKQLAEVTAEVTPGAPDRLAAICQRLEKCRAEIDTIRMLSPASHLPKLWRMALQLLESAGTRIITEALSTAKATGDLAAARGDKFTPKGDGTLQLLRPQGPQAAAEDVAAWLTRVELPGTVIIAPGPLLDLALHQHGLPSLGAPQSMTGNALLEILPLVLAMGWSPPDPQRALELLTLPISPIPRALAWRLVNALKEWPAVDSDDWRHALADGLRSIEDKDDCTRLADRMGILLKPTIRGDVYPAEELHGRVHALEQWLRGRLESDEAAAEPWGAALGQCLNLQRLVQLTRLAGLKRPQLQRLVEEATATASPIAPLPAQAGLHSVSSPGEIAGAADRIIWWNFTRDSAPAQEQPPLRAAERAALEKIGVELPPPGQAAVSAAGRWCRPLNYASKCLLLVCPLNGEDGEEQHPHPLWDEIVARAEDSDVSRLVRQTPVFPKPPAMRKHPLLPLPQSRPEWPLPSGYKPQRRETESPTAAAKLLGCPFQWVLEYMGNIRPGQSAALPDLEALIGSVAHELIARLLKDGLSSAAAAESKALEWFDSEGPRLAAPLFIAGAEPLKARSRQATGRAARILVEQLAKARLKVLGVETDHDKPALGGKLGGRVDLIAGPPPVIIDLKWSGETYRRKELENGVALQLACYSYLLSTKGHIPPIAFFILNTQRLLTTQPGLFPGAKVVTGPGPQETWAAFVQAYEERWKQLKEGTVAATGKLTEAGALDPPASILEEGRLRVTPGCKYCPLGLLCGYGLEAP